MSSATVVPGSDRMRMILLGLALCVAVIGGMFAKGVSDAEARVVWCSADPIISVNGQLISVTVNVPSDKVDQVNKAVVVFHVPSNATAEVVFVDQTLFPEEAVIVFDGKPWNGKGKLGVKVDVTVYADSDFKIGVQVDDYLDRIRWYDGKSNDERRFETFGFVPRATGERD